ncbi:MAG: type I 3-dehydroquinate dehydratase [Halobacteriota archaeon]
MQGPEHARRPAIVASTDDLDHAGRVAQTADLLELRLDLGDATAADVSAYSGTPPLILTDREGPLERGHGALLDLLEVADVWGVDVDHARLDDDLAGSIRRSGARLVCSAHPTSADDLAVAVEAVRDWGDVGKVALQCDDADAFAALVEHALAAQTEPLALMATGPYGPHSRLLAVSLAQPIVYGHVPEATPTAPGQLDVETLRTVREALAAAR